MAFRPGIFYGDQHTCFQDVGVDFAYGVPTWLFNCSEVLELEARSVAANGNNVNKIVETALSIMRFMVTISGIFA